MEDEWSVAVNRNGSFFKVLDATGKAFTVPAWPPVAKRSHSGGTLQAQATILIH
jgi:hypothetical protein